MPKRNQLADLKRLISLPSRDVKNHYLKYIYENPNSVISLLFRLAKSELSRLERNNILTLLKYLFDEMEDFHSSIPDWMASNLNSFLQNPSFTDSEKASILSNFDPEELFSRVNGFERFVQRFMDIRESFEEYVVREIRGNRSRLYDIFTTIIKRSKHHVIQSMIKDLEDSEYPEALHLLELFTYVPDPVLSSTALHALAESRSYSTIPILYSISKLNPLFSEDAQSAYIKKIKRKPAYRTPVKKSQGHLEIHASFVDGNGSLSVIIGKRTARNEYFLINILFKNGVGIKDVYIFTSMRKKGYEEIIREYKEEMKLYKISEDLFKKLLKHFVHIGIESGYGVPFEIIALKNIVPWDDIEPESFLYSGKTVSPAKYTISDLEKFPFDNWWLHDNIVYNILSPYRDFDLTELPDTIFLEISAIYLEHAQKELISICDICAEIIINAHPEKGKKRAGIFHAIKHELLTPQKDTMESLFLSYQTINTVHNTLYNLSKGINSVEFG